MAALARMRPLFHSEADFQHAFAWQLRSAHPDARIRLAGYQFFGTEVRAGQPIMFALQWQTDATPAERRLD